MSSPSSVRSILQDGWLHDAQPHQIILFMTYQPPRVFVGAVARRVLIARIYLKPVRSYRSFKCELAAASRRHQRPITLSPSSNITDLLPATAPSHQASVSSQLNTLPLSALHNKLSNLPTSHQPSAMYTTIIDTSPYDRTPRITQRSTTDEGITHLGIRGKIQRHLPLTILLPCIRTGF